MLFVHHRRLRLGAAIATVLAVTLGGGALSAAPAGAAGASAAGVSAAAGSSGLLPMVPGARLAAAGADGFLTSVTHEPDIDGKLRWTPYGGGPARDTVFDVIDGRAFTSGDVVVTVNDHGVRWTDMSTGDSFAMATVDDGPDSLYGGLAGKALFIRGARNVWMQTADAAPRVVHGVEEADVRGWVHPGDATHGLVDVDADGVPRIGLIDLSDATVSYPYPQQARNPVVSGNRLAWVEDDTAANTLRIVVRDRTTGTDTAFPLPGTTAGASLPIGLLGDWVTYGTTALHTTDGEKVTLLERTDSASTVPDGSAQIVQGAGSTQGEGVFRVTLSADDRPVVQILAHAGTPTSALHDADNDGYADLFGRDASGVLWRDGAGDGRPRARIGGGWQIYNAIESIGDVVGEHSPDFVPELVGRDSAGVLWLYSGREDGSLTPRVRVGGGWQVYTHLTGGSDFTGDGRPDLVATDAAGRLWLYRSTGDTARPFETRRQIGTGWTIYNQVTAVGNLAGAQAGDLVARDKDGVLWLYLSKGDGTFTQRTRISAGWLSYAEIAGAGDVDHDGKADLLAYYPGTSTVYLYAGTGDPLTPLKNRVVSDAQTGNAYNRVS